MLDRFIQIASMLQTNPVAILLMWTSVLFLLSLLGQDFSQPTCRNNSGRSSPKCIHTFLETRCMASDRGAGCRVGHGGHCRLNDTTLPKYVSGQPGDTANCFAAQATRRFTGSVQCVATATSYCSPRRSARPFRAQPPIRTHRVERAKSSKIGLFSPMCKTGHSTTGRDLRCATSRLGIWNRYLTYPHYHELHVYPDMQQLQKYSLLARTNRLSLMGVRRHRKIGQDNEFERLRDFTLDDQFKHIDWRSTARRNKLTVRDFQVNQSQRVVFLVDCGRMMVNREGEWTLLDHSLNAMLMLSYVALRQGDAVGMLAFSNRIHAYVPPRGGARQMNHLLHASFDRFPELVESRYDQAFLHLSKKCRKRTLLVLITNLIDQVNADQIQNYLGALATRHLPLCVFLRDHRLFDAADSPIENPQDVFTSAAAASILTWRHQVLNQMQHQGVMILDTFPDALTAPLVNRYLDIKARHLL